MRAGLEGEQGTVLHPDVTVFAGTSMAVDSVVKR